MAAIRILLLLLLSAPAISFGQVNRYVVFFKDKNGSPYSVTKPEQFLSSKAIERRAKQQIPIIAEDIPVNSTYVAQVKAAGAKTFFTSRWMNCVLIESTDAILQQINALPFVDKSTLAAPGQKLINGRSSINKRLKESTATSVTTTQLDMLGLT
ncbi:MAG TPA: peptidase S8, partial [Cyclobacteriaceae bacterium]|nr:peptidase S8 [Cyclobacteriaceae bacterium]